MKERPILMSGPMVRACLREVDPKTQTRRLVKPQPILESGAWYWRSPLYDNGGGCDYFHTKSLTGVMEAWARACPYGQPGDRLWVRETFRATEGAPRRAGEAPTEYVYRADQEPSTDGFRWKPAIHMPRAACRLVLEIAAVRVERLQDISEADAKAEGCRSADHATGRECILDPAMGSYRLHYRDLWDSLNAKRAPWSSNPWVWVVEFNRRNEK